MSNDSKQKLVDPVEFRSVLGRFATGVTVVTTEVDGQVRGMTVNAFISVSLEPFLVLISVDNKSRMNSLLPLSQRFGVSVLSEGQEALSSHFAGRAPDEIHFEFIREMDMPLIKGAIGYLVADVVATHTAGDHTLFIGEVNFLRSEKGDPLLFYNGEYRQLSEKESIPGPYPEDDFSMYSLTKYLADQGQGENHSDS